MKEIVAAVLSLLMCVVTFGQTRPEFEVASIRPAPDQGLQVEVGLTINESQARFASFSLKDYIAMAYGLKVHQVSGPDWLGNEKFNIAAKLPDGAKTDQVGAMLQALLEDRFRLKTHRDKKEFPVYALEIAKGGLKINESVPEPEARGNGSGGVTVSAGGSGAGGGVNFGNGSFFGFGNNKFEAKKLRMPDLVEALSRFVDRPIVDMTNLKGGYDFILELSPQDYNAMLIRSAVAAGIVLPPQVLRAIEGGSIDSLSDAFEKLGLTFSSRREAIEIIVVDSMEKVPTEN